MGSEPTRQSEVQLKRARPKVAASGNTPLHFAPPAAPAEALLPRTALIRSGRMEPPGGVLGAASPRFSGLPTLRSPHDVAAEVRTRHLAWAGRGPALHGAD